MKYIESIEEFNDFIKQEKVLIDFYADWCGPCKMMAPILESIAEDDNSFKVARIDTDEADDLSREYGIMSIPCIIYFKDGKEVSRSVGLVSKDDLFNMKVVPVKKRFDKDSYDEKVKRWKRNWNKLEIIEWEEI